MIKLTEEDVTVFKIFIHSLYTGNLRGYFYYDARIPPIRELRAKARKEIRIANVKCTSQVFLQDISGKAILDFREAMHEDAPVTFLIKLYILADGLQVEELIDGV